MYTKPHSDSIILRKTEYLSDQVIDKKAAFKEYLRCIALRVAVVTDSIHQSDCLISHCIIWYPVCDRIYLTVSKYVVMQCSKSATIHTSAIDICIITDEPYVCINIWNTDVLNRLTLINKTYCVWYIKHTSRLDYIHCNSAITTVIVNDKFATKDTKAIDTIPREADTINMLHLMD